MKITQPMTNLELSDHDKNSDLWGRLLAYYTKRERQLQIENSGDLTQEQTWKTRGRLAEITAFIKLNEDKPLIEKSSWDTPPA